MTYLPLILHETIDNLKNEKWINHLISMGNVYIVGGTVRDAFLNKPIKDIDLIVENISLETIRKELSFFGKVDIVGESFSVIKFKPEDYKGEPYEIATPRMDRKVGEGHKGFEIVTEGVDILMDLKRRDFTINSIAIDLFNETLIDPFNGLDDLNDKNLRATDKRAFIEDPLRMIRGIQFASRFRFNIEESTLQMMKENCHLIEEISGERIFEEFEKIINKDGDTGLAFKLLKETQLDRTIFGKEMMGIPEDLGILDSISFYYIMALLGGVDPEYFLRVNLKANNEIIRDVATLDKIFGYINIVDEEEKRWRLLKDFSKAPNVRDAVILPNDIDDIVLQMRTGKIPMTMKDLRVNGNDVITVSKETFDIDIKGTEIGRILELLMRDALMNRFDWTSSYETFSKLCDIIYKINNNN
ncbi:MAG: CCA tRNA nucleotidyltransferase [Nanoarchaeota archaeon]